jgi:ketosteroid isomerase-like protein
MRGVIMSAKRCWSLAWVLVLLPVCTVAQSMPRDSVESVIRRLDAAEAQGLLTRDSTSLRRIWAPDFTVNNPRNSITRGADEVVALIRNGTIDYSSFTRTIEAMLFHGDVVIVMGSEVIGPVRKAPFAGQTVQRRFTHFWMRRGGEWRLTARHANVVVQP